MVDRHAELCKVLPQSNSGYEANNPNNDVDDAKDLCRRRYTFFILPDFIDRDCLEHVISFANCKNT